MTIPLDIFWGGVIALMGFILGTLWGHHAAIGKRVTYAECSKNRSACECVKRLEEMHDLIDEMHPHRRS